MAGASQLARLIFVGLLAGWLASYRRRKAEKRNTSDHPGA